MMQRFETVLIQRPSLVDEIVKWITPESVIKALIPIADTPSPSGVSSLTRGPIIQEWFESQKLMEKGVTLDSNLFDSGTEVLSFGKGGISLFAHLDEVSYLFREPIKPGLARITPYCYHLAKEPVPARIIRFNSNGGWKIICEAEVYISNNDYFVSYPVDVEFGFADRVVLASSVTYDANSGLLTGSMDNAAGVAAALIACDLMAHLGIPFNCYLTDEEEGPAGSSSQTISRGASRILRHVEQAPLSAIIDIHGLNEVELAKTSNHQISWGASLAEFSSGGRGSVSLPEILLTLSETFSKLEDNGIRVRQNIGGYVPRSDDVVAMLQSNRLVVLGYPGINRHFDQGLPTVNLHDLVNLARALVVIGAMVSPIALTMRQ